MKKVLCILSMLICMSCVQNENNLYVCFQEHIDKKEYRKAASVLEKWDKQYPESADLCLAHVQLVHAMSGQDAETLSQAVEILGRGIEKNEYRLDLRLERANTLWSMDRIDECQSEIGAILSRITDDSNTWKQAFNEPFNNALNSIESLILELYKYLMDNALYCEARQLADSSQSRFPNNADLCLARVQLLKEDVKHEMDALSQAVEMLGRGIEKNEYRLDLRFDRANLLCRMGKTDNYLSEVYAILSKVSGNTNPWKQAFNEPFENASDSIENFVLDGYKMMIEKGLYYEAGEIVGWSRHYYPNHTGLFIENAEHELELEFFIPAIVHFSDFQENEYDSILALKMIAFAEYRVGFHDLAKEHYHKLASMGSEQDKAVAKLYVEKIDSLNTLEAEKILVSLLMNVPTGSMINNVEMSELYNETLFAWLTAMPDMFVEAMEKVNSDINKVIYNRVLEELSNPINDGIDVRSIVQNLTNNQL